MENTIVRFGMNAQRPNRQGKKDKVVPRAGCSLPTSSIRVSNKRDKKFYREHFQTVDYYSRDTSIHNPKKDFKGQETDCVGYSHISSQILLFPDSACTGVPDNGVLPNWSHVASIYVSNNEDIYCPICLCTPFVPRIEKCGHVYCYPCAVRYIRYENDCNEKKCAICSWILKIGNFKRVCFVKTQNLMIGQEIEMTLVKRKENENAVYPVNESSKPSFKYQCIFKASSEVLQSLKENELDELLTYRGICETDRDDMEMLTYIDYVLDEINLEMDSSRNKIGNSSIVDFDIDKSSREFYFYQEANGQPIFLDGLMWKCLLVDCENESLLPEVFKSKIISITNYRMHSQLRRRFKYLGHLPDGYLFSLIDIDLASLISPETLERFSDSLNKRSIERSRLQLEDLRLTKLKEAAENRIMPGYFSSNQYYSAIDNLDALCNENVSDNSFVAISQDTLAAPFNISTAVVDESFATSSEEWPTLTESSDLEKAVRLSNSDCWKRFSK